MLTIKENDREAEEMSYLYFKEWLVYVEALEQYQTIACLGVGYSDFHNLMGFTSKKMPNNNLYNVG